MILQADACFICSCIVLQVLSLPEEEEEERGQCEAQQSGDIQHFSKVREHIYINKVQVLPYFVFLKGGWSELESGVQKMHIGIVSYL